MSAEWRLGRKWIRVLTQNAEQSGVFYRNMSVCSFNIKDLINSVSFIWCVLYGTQGICTREWMQHLYLSMQSVTKHGDRSPSLTSVNWVSDGVGINFIEYMCYKSVHFYNSLE